MTREELREHCEKQIRACEMWAHSQGERPCGKIYEEHKLILELLEQEPRWISVNEQLPQIHNYSESYLVTLSNGEVTKAMFTEVNGKSWWEWTQYKVIAWMSLPKAYEPQESEDKE